MRQGLVGTERVLAFVLNATGSNWEVFSVTWKDSHLKGPAAAECQIDCGQEWLVLAALSMA